MTCTTSSIRALLAVRSGGEFTLTKRPIRRHLQGSSSGEESTISCAMEGFTGVTSGLMSCRKVVHAFSGTISILSNADMRHLPLRLRGLAGNSTSGLTAVADWTGQFGFLEVLYQFQFHDLEVEYFQFHDLVVERFQFHDLVVKKLKFHDLVVKKLQFHDLVVKNMIDRQSARTCLLEEQSELLPPAVVTRRRCPNCEPWAHLPRDPSRYARGRRSRLGVTAVLAG
ncbi:hypothetical protein JTB14_009926 [Gonioctena quinquepunctata]|nr:hypothetical protein JTB14_009926 [Gonioctena quinquepunctata]